MKLLLIFLLMLAGSFLIFWLRAFPFREKKCREPEQSAKAAVVSRRIRSGNPHRSGRSQMGYTYLVTFRLENGAELELYTYEIEYGALREGMTGTLTWKGRYYIAFAEEAGIPGGMAS